MRVFSFLFLLFCFFVFLFLSYFKNLLSQSISCQLNQKINPTILIFYDRTPSALKYFIYSIQSRSTILLLFQLNHTIVS